ncbi:MAG: hypothetical protein ACFFE7_16610 [Candidatus Thorarchaeota archaeon]
MNKSKTGIALLVIVAGIIMIPLAMYGPEFPNTDPGPGSAPEFYWGVDVGDTFLYNVSYYPNSYDYPTVIFFQIQVEITSLPSLAEVSNVTSFESQILDSRKVNCTILDENASSFSTSTISAWLSFGFLPLGGWNWIEGAFPQYNSITSWNMGYDEYLIATRMYSDRLVIQKDRGFMTDQKVGIAANVSLSNGVPTYVVHYDIIYSGGPEIIYHFMLDSSDLNTTA